MRLWLAVTLVALSAPMTLDAQTVGLPPDAQRGLHEQAGILSRQMIGSPEFTQAMRIAYENATRAELAKPDPDGGEPFEPELIEQLCAATGQLYEDTLKATISVPIDAATKAFEQHLQKYELDRIVAFLGTSAGLKFLSISFRAAGDVKTGKVAATDVGKTMSASFDEQERADFNAFAEPSVLAHWKEAVAAYQPASIAWANDVSDRLAPRIEEVSRKVSKQFYAQKDAE